MPATLRPAESQRADVQKPQPFGKYYLLERINVGGMAEVFLAERGGDEGFKTMVLPVCQRSDSRVWKGAGD